MEISITETQKLLVRDWIQSFLEEIIIPKYEMKYTKIEIQESDNFVLYFIDLLKPDLSSGKLNYQTHEVFTVSIETLYSISSKNDLYSLLINGLEKNKNYLNYLIRFY